MPSLAQQSQFLIYQTEYEPFHDQRQRENRSLESAFDKRIKVLTDGKQRRR
jgi:hypothetical protein